MESPAAAAAGSAGVTLPASSTFESVPRTPTGHDATCPSLTAGELDGVRRALGPTASVLSCAVAKLYVCEKGDTQYRWTGVWGALVLVVDRAPPSSKALQIYTLHPTAESTHAGTPACACTFSVQLYECLTYLAPNHLFHTFEVEEGLVGLSFADTNEAHEFLVKVRAHIPPHGTVQARPAKKASFLARLFGGGSSPGDSPGKDANAGISAPSSVVKHDLPEEWSNLFKNAATIANNKAVAERQQQQAASAKSASSASPSSTS